MPLYGPYSLNIFSCRTSYSEYPLYLLYKIYPPRKHWYEDQTIDGVPMRKLQVFFLVVAFFFSKNCLFISKTKNFNETFPVLSLCNFMRIVNCLILQAHKNSRVMLCFIFTHYIYIWYSIVCDYNTYYYITM